MPRSHVQLPSGFPGAADGLSFYLYSSAHSAARVFLSHTSLPVRELSDIWELSRRQFVPEAHRAQDRVVLVIDHSLTEAQKASILGIVMTNAAVVVGPAAADEFMWQAKAQANAMGAIFDVAADDSSFVRLTAIACQAVLQRDVAFRCNYGGGFKRAALMHSFLPTWPESGFWNPVGARIAESNLERFIGGNAMPAQTPPSQPDELGGLPGVLAVTHQLRSEKGKLDAEKVRAWFGLSRAELARICGKLGETIRATPDSDSLQECLQPFDRVARLLVLENDPKKFATWLNTANDELDGKTPLELIKERRIDVVATLVHDIISNRAR